MDFPANLLSCDLLAFSPHLGVHWAENGSTLCLLLGTRDTHHSDPVLWMWGEEELAELLLRLTIVRWRPGTKLIALLASPTPAAV